MLNLWLQLRTKCNFRETSWISSWENGTIQMWNLWLQLCTKRNFEETSWSSTWWNMNKVYYYMLIKNIIIFMMETFLGKKYIIQLGPKPQNFKDWFCFWILCIRCFKTVLWPSLSICNPESEWLFSAGTAVV